MIVWLKIHTMNKMGNNEQMNCFPKVTTRKNMYRNTNKR